jgi:hypothetical protein
MKRTEGPAKPQTTDTVQGLESVMSRIQLAFLEDFTRERRGYDPYDSSKSRSPDIWALKRKRA